MIISIFKEKNGLQVLIIENLALNFNSILVYGKGYTKIRSYKTFYLQVLKNLLYNYIKKNL